MKTSKIILVLLVAVLCSSMSVRAGAGENAVEKLGRGIANVISSPFELLLNIQDIGKKDGWVAGGTYGLTRGLYHTVIRAGCGIADVVSFPIYTKPMIEPEYLFNPEDSGVYEWELR